MRKPLSRLLPISGKTYFKFISYLLLIILCTNIAIFAQTDPCESISPSSSNPLDTMLWGNSVTGCDPIPECGFEVCENTYDYTDDNETLTINVIVHVIQQEGTPNIDYSSIDYHFEKLNEVFAGEMATNMTAIDTKIEFQLADTDPNGEAIPIPGIQEYELTPLEYNEIFEGLTNQDATYRAYANFHWPNNYINVYLINDTDNVNRAGLASPVRLRETIFSVNNLSYKTVAHEFAHYLGLQHTFTDTCEEVGTDDGQADDDCITNGDYICDTQATDDLDGIILCYPNNGYIDNLDPVAYNIMTYSGNLIREGFTEQQKQRMRYFLKNNLFSLVNTPIGDTDITNEVSYGEENIFVDGIITVKNDGKLTFDGSTVFFSPRSRIYVELGGILEIKECAYLSSVYNANLFYPYTDYIFEFGPDPQQSDVLWDGIVVYGIGNQNIDVSVDDPGFMGLVRVENSTISFANEAIANYNGLSDEITKPGLIQVENSNFFNNYNSIHITSHRYASFSNQIKDCLFTQSRWFACFYEEDLFQPNDYLNSIDKFQVIVRNSNDFEIAGNHFLNSSIYPPHDFKGIKATNCSLSIGTELGEIDDPDGNTFDRLTSAIEIYGINDLASLLQFVQILLIIIPGVLLLMPALFLRWPSMISTIVTLQ